MDLARRLIKIVNNNQGLLVFLKLAQPLTGFVTVRKVVSFRLADITADELVEQARNFIITNLLAEDGVTMFRRGGFVTFGRITWFATQPEAELAARTQAISHIVNVADNTTIQVGDFQPNVPGDGDV